MKRIAVVFVLAVADVVMFAMSAAAQYPPSPTEGPDVLGETVAPPGGSDVAFTGSSDFERSVLILGVLLVLGISLLVVSRRRAVRHGE